MQTLMCKCNMEIPLHLNNKINLLLNNIISLRHNNIISLLLNNTISHLHNKEGIKDSLNNLVTDNLDKLSLDMDNLSLDMDNLSQVMNNPNPDNQDMANLVMGNQTSLILIKDNHSHKEIQINNIID